MGGKGMGRAHGDGEGRVEGRTGRDGTGMVNALLLKMMTVWFLLFSLLFFHSRYATLCHATRL